MKRCILLSMLLFLLLPVYVLAEDTVWTLRTEHGQTITSITYEPEAGDRYISSDNHLYQAVAVEDGDVILRDQGEIELPDVSWIEDTNALQPVGSLFGEKRIGLYCTHSDESYEPTDGVYSTNDRGSIYQVAHLLASQLEDRGITCDVSDALHHPHDAGAYRRSRQTAIQLIKAMPDALFDIHRDGIPDPAEYSLTIGGREASKIRLLVGRGNQNMEVNQELALLIKAIADKVYPGLIKDIYMGRGAFNQDLMANALLLECGTYTMKREHVDQSMPMMADVIYRALYGGVTGSAGVNDTRARSVEEQGGITQGAPDYLGQAETKASVKGIGWLAGLFVIGLILYGVLSAGSWKGGIKKAERHLSEMTGGLAGKKPDDRQGK